MSAVPAGSSYRIDTPRLDASVNAAGVQSNLTTQIKVANCDLQVQWRYETHGTVATGLHPSGRIVGVTKQTMRVHYDAAS